MRVAISKRVGPPSKEAEGRPFRANEAASDRSRFLRPHHATLANAARLARGEAGSTAGDVCGSQADVRREPPAVPPDVCMFPAGSDAQKDLIGPALIQLSRRAPHPRAPRRGEWREAAREMISLAVPILLFCFFGVAVLAGTDGPSGLVGTSLLPLVFLLCVWDVRRRLREMS